MPAPKKKTVKKPSAAKPAAKAPAKKSAAKSAAKPAKKAAAKTAKATARKAPAKKAVKAKAPVKKAPAKTVKKAAPRLPADPVRDLAIDMARMAADLHCTDVLVQDVSGHSTITRFIVLASGVSNRQLKAVAQQLEELGAARNHPRYRSDADANTTWVVLDLVDIMIHLFEPAARAHYDLETQFPDAKNVTWQR